VTVATEDAVRWSALIVHALRTYGLTDADVLVLSQGTLARSVAQQCATRTGQFVVAWPEVEGPAGERDSAIAGQVRAAFAERRRSGRCDVAVPLDGDLARAATVVRRGGTVLLPPHARRQPAMTTVVQREVSLRPLGAMQ
jgi:hypothetical protein